MKPRRHQSRNGYCDLLLRATQSSWSHKKPSIRTQLKGWCIRKMCGNTPREVTHGAGAAFFERGAASAACHLLEERDFIEFLLQTMIFCWPRDPTLVHCVHRFVGSKL